MKGYNCQLWLIECISNLHVGSGDSNYDVIDKQVQRDPITNYPVIHASGLKGALREYFNHLKNIASSDITDSVIRNIFGSSTTDSDMQQGNYRFFEANLLSMPVRATDNNVFYRATTKDILEHLKNTLSSFEIKYDLPNSNQTTATMKFEDGESDQSFGYNLLLGNNSIKISNQDFQQRTKNLPVIARNYLNNGQSENLWYEEVVPREARFYAIVATNGNEDLFEKSLEQKIVQIGANASVGYGFCKFSLISKA